MCPILFAVYLKKYFANTVTDAYWSAGMIIQISQFNPISGWGSYRGKLQIRNIKYGYGATKTKI